MHNKARQTELVRVTQNDHTRLKRMGKKESLQIKEVIGRLIAAAYRRWMAKR